MVKTELNIPKIRFKGFAGDWQSKKLSQISSRVQEKNRDNQITETFTNSAERGIISQRDFFDRDISNDANLDGYYVVQPNDFVYNPRISNFAPVGPIKRNKLGRAGVMSPLYSVFRPYSNIVDNAFLEHYFSTSNWHKFMFINGDQGARSDRFAIGMATFQKMPIDLPILEEQTQIGNFFQKLDQIIELQQKALETTKDYKKSMLQKMFPQKGEKVPKIRFDGFSGDWEEKQLGEIVDITTGKLDANAMKVDGEYDFYTSGIQKYKIDVFAFLGPAITIAGNGATVGYMHYADGKFNAYQRTYVLTNFKANREYLYSLISLRLPPKIHTEARAGNIPYIVMNMLTELDIVLPEIKEQSKIGEFFQKLDQQIEQQEKKLENYQNLKKAMLQRMFV